MRPTEGRGRPPGRPAGRGAGLSVLEVLVAALLFAVVVASAAAVLSLAGTHGALGKRSTDAATVAVAEVERLRDLPYDRIPPGEARFTVQFGGSTYHVRREVEPDTPEAGMKQVTVEVTYDLMGQRTFRTQVIFTDLMRPAPVPTP